MIRQFSQGVYKYFLKCLDDFKKSHYRQAIEESLVIDEAIYKLGFMRYPTYTISISISITDLNELSEIAKEIKKNDEEKYDHYLDFFNIINELRRSSTQP